MKNKLFSLILMASMASLLSGCDSKATVASHNLSKAADNFEIVRRVVFYNGITGDYMLTMEGKCSITVDRPDAQLEVTCMTGPNQIKKNYLGLADNVTYLIEQLDGVGVSQYHYKINFRPQSLLPDVDLDTEGHPSSQVMNQ